jgi:hypothetical protein
MDPKEDRMTGQGSTSTFPTASVALPVDGWRSAFRCGPNGGNCVEVNLAATAAAGIVGVRDSKPGHGPVLVFRPAGWRSFVTAAARGELRA